MDHIIKRVLFRGASHETDPSPSVAPSVAESDVGSSNIGATRLLRHSLSASYARDTRAEALDDAEGAEELAAASTGDGGVGLVTAIRQQFRRAYSQKSLKQVLNLEQFSFIKDIEPRAESLSQPARRKGSGTGASADGAPAPGSSAYSSVSPRSPLMSGRAGGSAGSAGSGQHRMSDHRMSAEDGRGAGGGGGGAGGAASARTSTPSVVLHDSSLTSQEFINAIKAIRDGRAGSVPGDAGAAGSNAAMSPLSAAGGGATPQLLASAAGSTAPPIVALDADAILASMTRSQSEAEEESNIIVTSPDLPPAMSRAKWSVQDYELLKQVHRGYASDVYQAVCKRTDKMVALKVYTVDQLEDIPRVQLSREISIHHKCQHPNIVQFHAAFVEDLPSLPEDAPPDSEATSMSRAVVLVVGWCGGGNLLRFMKHQGGVLSEAKAVNLVMLPLLRSLHYLHSQGIVHRDLKPENMIFDEDMVLKMADFGLALDLKEERANTRAGTLDYMAPEVLMCPTKKSPADNKFEQNSRHYTTGADAWAVGAIFYELLVGAPPFRSDTMTSTAQNIINGEITYPARVSASARNLISACLCVEPADRPTVVELMEHEVLDSMRRRASFRMAAMRSNSFVEFLQQQQKMDAQADQRKLMRANSSGLAQAKYLSSLDAEALAGAGGLDDDDEEEDDVWGVK